MTHYLAGISDDYPDLLYLSVIATTLSDDHIADAAHFFTHLSSPKWHGVCLSFQPNRQPCPLDQARPPPCLSTDDLVAQWSAIDEALSHSNYDNVTEISISCDQLQIDALPSGYECIKDLASKLLPRQMERGRLQVHCHPESSNEDVVCAYHRFASIRNINLENLLTLLSCRSSRKIKADEDEDFEEVGLGFPHSCSPSAKGKKLPRVMMVTCTFVCSLPDELLTKIGETLRLLEEYEDEWCMVQRVGKNDAEKGIIPRSCLQEFPEVIAHPSQRMSVSSIATRLSSPHRTPAAPSLKAANGKKLPRLMMATCTFIPSLPDELFIEIGEALRLVEEYKDEWCRVQRVGKYDAEQGVIPRFSLKERPELFPRRLHKMGMSSVAITFAPIRALSVISRQYNE